MRASRWQAYRRAPFLRHLASTHEAGPEGLRRDSDATGPSTPGVARVWVDLANSPQVLFFSPLIQAWRSMGLEVLVTTRPYAHTTALADQLGIQHEPIGERGRGGVGRLGLGLVLRARALARWGKGRHLHVATSHNSYAQIVAARLLGVTAVTAMDFEHHFANHGAFRLASRVVVPEAFPEEALRRFGALGKAVRYPGVKELVYLTARPTGEDFRVRHGLWSEAVLAVVRPPAEGAAYHRFKNPLWQELIVHLVRHRGVQVVLLPRDTRQAEVGAELLGTSGVIPNTAWNGPGLLAAADVVFSGGGTMAREAAVLGTPAFSFFAGARLGVDQYLERLGRLTYLESAADIAALTLARKSGGCGLLEGGERLVELLARVMLGPALH